LNLKTKKEVIAQLTMAGYSLHRIGVVDIKEQVPIANKPSMFAIRNSVGCLEYVQTPFPSSSM
jgi:hypothetical protein